MTTPNSSPARLVAYLGAFGAALIFSVLFMFALSGFVNMLYDTSDKPAGNPVEASGTAAGGAPGEQTAATPPVVAKPAAKPAEDAAKPPAQTAPVAAPAKPAMSLAELLAGGDAKKGEKVAKKCLACHSFEKGGKNKVGPNLYGIVNKPIAGNGDFKYSPAMKNYAEKAKNWSYENLAGYLKKPKKVVPKTKMAFAGLRKDKDLANLIAYLRTNADEPAPLPAN